MKAIKAKKVKAHLVQQKVYILFLQYKYYPKGFEQYGSIRHQGKGRRTWKGMHDCSQGPNWISCICTVYE